MKQTIDIFFINYDATLKDNVVGTAPSTANFSLSHLTYAILLNQFYGLVT